MERNLTKFFSGRSNYLSQPDVEATWSEEIKGRLAEIDAGTVELIHWEEVRAELFGESE